MGLLGQSTVKPTIQQAQDAVRLLIEYAGDDPSREGLIDTPERVVRAWGEWFEGYTQDPLEMLSKTFEQVQGYDEIIVLSGIRLESHCEHHMVPIIGEAHVAYLPNNRVVGISKLARVVDAYAKRLQIQETLTAQVADAIVQALQPRGVAVVIRAQHLCMTTRGVHKNGVKMTTACMRGVFQSQPSKRAEVLSMMGIR